METIGITGIIWGVYMDYSEAADCAFVRLKDTKFALPVIRWIPPG